MNQPERPRLPRLAPNPPPDRPHPLRHPDERKEGGPDFGKAAKQQENKARTEQETAESAR